MVMSQICGLCFGRVLGAHDMMSIFIFMPAPIGGYLAAADGS